MHVAGNGQLTEAIHEPGRQSEVGFVDELGVGLERIGAIRDAVEDGPRFDRLDQGVEAGIDQQIDLQGVLFR